ncbi:hypothetical protein CB1_000465045 [Camelus ferus]|nr:hypothetical protein CB1_000465045 [Camelus ferus]
MNLTFLLDTSYSVYVLLNASLTFPTPFTVLTFLLGHRPKPTDLTVAQLALIHTVKLITMGFITTGMFATTSSVNQFST